MSTKQSAQAVSTKSIETNPLAMLERGIQPPTYLPRHRRSAATGNLYFEYVQNVPTLRGIVRSGQQVAEYLEYRNLITWDRTMDRYTWKKEPMSKADFLRMFQVPAQQSKN